MSFVFFHWFPPAGCFLQVVQQAVGMLVKARPNSQPRTRQGLWDPSTLVARARRKVQAEPDTGQVPLFGSGAFQLPFVENTPWTGYRCRILYYCTVAQYDDSLRNKLSAVACRLFQSPGSPHWPHMLQASVAWFPLLNGRVGGSPSYLSILTIYAGFTLSCT